MPPKTKQEAVVSENTKLTKIGQFTKEDVKEYICPGATDKEIVIFLNVANMFKLNPLKREIYLVKYPGSPAQMLVGFEVYLKRAERSKKWNGFKVETAGSGADGDLRAICTIWRKDWEHPLIHEVYLSEYIQLKKDGTPNKFWKTKPRTMIKKVAISQAFRMTFPDDLGGMPYTEFDFDAKDVIDVKGEDVEMPKEKPVQEPKKTQTKKKAVEPIEEAEIVQPQAPQATQEASEPVKQEEEAMDVISEDQVGQLKKITTINGYNYKEIIQIIGQWGHKRVKEIKMKHFGTIMESLGQPAKDWRHIAELEKKQQQAKDWGE